MLKRLTLAALAVPLLAAAFPSAASAQEKQTAQVPDEIAEPTQITLLNQRAEDVIAVMRGQKPADEVFAADFLSAVPPAQLAAVNDQMTAQFGEIVGIESVTPIAPNAARIAIRFERAIGSGNMQLGGTAPHRVAGLLMNEFAPVNDSADKIREDLSALPGDVSVHFAPLDDGGVPILSLNPDRQMAIGSTFKLYVLSALAKSVQNGSRDWTDVVELNRRSFPSGVMQGWPDGAPVTLHTLAALMISISDNTATDMLMHEIGRDAVDAELLASGHSDADRTLPMLSTLEMFGLKGSPGNLRKYVDADEAGQRAILADFEDDIGGKPDLVTPPRFAEPTAIDTVEWFANAADLQNLATGLMALTDPTAREIMAVSPAMPEPVKAKWAYAGFKGGSEPGVLNLTWLLQDKAGAWHILTMSWNNTDATVDHSAFELMAQRILALAN